MPLSYLRGDNSMAMDIRKIRKLIELLKEQSIAEIEICEGEDSVRINQFASGAGVISQPLPQQIIAPPQPQTIDAPEAATSKNVCDASNTINAPMVGTFYLTPSPDADAFVEVGQSVKTGDILCIVEAMKMFNQIEADRAGTIKAILVENGHPVEFGQPLFVIE